MAPYPRTKRTPEQVDQELKNVRVQLLDSVNGSTRWKAAWERIDRLLDERLKLSSSGQEPAGTPL